MLDALRRMVNRGFARDTSQLGFDFESATPTLTSPAPAVIVPEDSPRDAFTPEGRASPVPALPDATKVMGNPGAARSGLGTPSRGRAATRAREALFHQRLQTLGLRGIDSITLMRTRRVMASVIGRTLRVHEGYTDAPEPVLRALVTFATARTRAARATARDIILAHDVERAPPRKRPEPTRPADVPLLARLADAHRELNAKHFGGALQAIPVRLSSRMKTRLGHYSPAGEDAETSEIVIGRQHLRRDGWAEAQHTLLHEMIHQWQDETGRPLDHGPSFRRKAKDVGVHPRARRAIG